MKYTDHIIIPLVIYDAIGTWVLDDCEAQMAGYTKLTRDADTSQPDYFPASFVDLSTTKMVGRSHCC